MTIHRALTLAVLALAALVSTAGQSQPMPPAAPAAPAGPLAPPPPPPDDQQQQPPPAGPDHGNPPPPDHGTYPAPPPDQGGSPPPPPGGGADQGVAAPGYPDQEPGDQGANDLGDVSQFYNPLAFYGDWEQNPAWGNVWVPRGIRFGWRPYAEGHWVYTEDGWAWVSDEPFGWATYHYGRWLDDPDFGWEWVPGTVWAPAWVAWRLGGGYAGWAALPPTVGLRAGFGLEAGSIELNVELRPEAYCFVPEREILAPRVAEVLVPPARNVTIVHNTVDVTRYEVAGKRIVNHGVPVQHVEQVTGRKLRPLRIVPATAPARDRQLGNQVTFYRPELRARAAQGATPTARSLAGGRGAAALPPAATSPRQEPGQGAAPPPPAAASQGQAPATAARPKASNGANGANGAKGAGAGPAQGQLQAGGPRPPARNAPSLTPEELGRRHQSERLALEAYQQSERRRLQDLHQRELASQSAAAARDSLSRQHAAEMQAMQQQQQRERQALQSRQQRERQAPPPAQPRRPPPPHQPLPHQPESHSQPPGL